MRIRRRPPGQPLAYLLPTDPAAAQAPPPGAPRDRRERLAGDRKREDGGELHLHPNPNAAADLGAPAAGRSALLPLLPQDSVMERGRGLGAQQQRPAVADDDDGHGHRSLENGHRHVPESVIKAGERAISNDIGRGVAVAVAVAVAAAAAAEARMGGAHNNAMMKPEETKGGESNSSNSISGGGVKKPRGPGVLQEGSRCSRKNGRGWRCSQPTLVGYALCQYHLGKGRVRAAAAAAGGRSAGQLGRTEHVVKKAPAAAVAATPAPNKADDDVPPPPMAHGNGMA